MIFDDAHTGFHRRTHQQLESQLDSLIEMTTYLSGFKLKREPIIHERLQLLVILIIILPSTLALNLFQLIFIRQITLNGDVASIKDERLTIFDRDTARQLYPKRRRSTYSMGMMMIGAFMSTLISTVLWLSRAYSSPARVSFRIPSSVCPAASMSAVIDSS
jgi:hypothetical protein